MTALTKKAPGLLDGARRDIALQSTYEIEVLVSQILDILANGDLDIDHEPAMLLRSSAARIRTLSRAAIDAIYDDEVCVGELEFQVFGCLIKPAPTDAPEQSQALAANVHRETRQTGLITQAPAVDALAQQGEIQ